METSSRKVVAGGGEGEGHRERLVKEYKLSAMVEDE